MVNNNSPQTTSYVWRRHNYTLLKIVKSVHVVYIKFSITTVFVTVLGIRSHVFTEKKCDIYNFFSWITKLKTIVY